MGKILVKALSHRIFTRMSKRGMSKVMPKSRRFGEILVKTKRSGGREADLRRREYEKVMNSLRECDEFATQTQ